MMRVALWILLFVACAGLCIFLFTTPGCACGDIFPQRIYDLNALNPLRNKAPEQAAELFLRDQGQGKCSSVGSALCKYALSSHPVLNWQLVARKDDSSYMKLYYRVQGRESGNPIAFGGQAEVDVKLVGKVWQITGYDVVY